jgi:hypothetical protein
MTGKAQGTQIAVCKKYIRRQKAMTLHLRVQLAKAGHDLQEAINFIAQFDQGSNSVTLAELVPPCYASANASQPPISNDPIEAQIVSERMRKVQTSSPRHRRDSP